MAGQRSLKIFCTIITISCFEIQNYYIKKLIQNSPPEADQPRAEKLKNSRKGFTLIELMVAMFIFVLLMGAMVAVSVAGFRSYGKSKAVKTVSEDVGFAINSIAKDVRMGKIENGNNYATGSSSNYLFVTRNRDQVKVCYKITSTSLEIQEGATDCISGTYNKIVDLSSTSMQFDLGTAKFRSCVSDNKGDGLDLLNFPDCNGTTEKRRGWAEINLNIASPSMETDSISVQTVVSSRDYGWEDL
jgi:prepilin-type N-terminal cleavage/methylation domain-containing protein